MTTGYVYSSEYLAHDLRGHPENAGRLRRILEALEQHDLLDRLTLIPPRPAAEEDLLRVHTEAHIQRVRRMAQAGGGHLDPDTYVTPRSYEVALLAAGGVLSAVDAVLSGDVRNAFALVRPPGHHATPSRAMGFCLFNNVAIAARYALSGSEVQQVFIVDFDVHHGNGTQDIFEEDPAVFYCSTHEYPFYPGTGHWRESGRGAGEGSVLNVPLPAGVGDTGYLRVFHELIGPLARRFAPDLILVSAGFDAHWQDPLAMMRLSLSGYAQLARELVYMAEKLCSGRIIFVLEGGYHPQVIGLAVANVFFALLGEERVIDPFGPAPAGSEPDITDLIERLRALHRLSGAGED